MTFAFGVTVTRKRAGVTSDPYSGEDTLPDWDNTVDVNFNGCAVWQESSIEPPPAGSDLRAQVVTVTKATLPYDADIEPGDRFVTGGETYEVVGEVSRYHHPMTGWEPGAVVTGVRTDG